MFDVYFSLFSPEKKMTMNFGATLGLNSLMTKLELGNLPTQDGQVLERSHQRGLIFKMDRHRGVFSTQQIKQQISCLLPFIAQ